MVGSRNLICGLALACVVAAPVKAADFYSGRTMTFIVGIDAGSGADLSCRMIAEYLPRHIPGKPTIIVKNMPSPSGLIATNYIGREAKNDGLTALCGGYPPILQLFHDPAIQVDLTKLGIVTGDGESQMLYMRSDVPPGIKTGNDIFKVKPADITYGGFAANSQKDLAARAFLSLLKIDGYRYVTGFGGDSAGRAAVQQNFVNLWSEAMTSYNQITAPTLTKTGMVVPVAQSGTLDAAGKRIRDPRAPEVPTFGEVYQAHSGAAPSGPAWEVLDRVVSNVNVNLNIIALPPGSPPEALGVLRAAIAPLDADPDFVAASLKLRGPSIFERPANVTETALANFLGMPDQVRSYMDDLIKSGQAMQKKQ